MISHPDPEIQSIITSLQDSLDVAIVARAQLTAQVAALKANNEELVQQVADLNDSLRAAMEAQAAVIKAREPETFHVEQPDA